VITRPFGFEDACLVVPRGPGPGVELDCEQLDRFHRLYVEHGARDEFEDEQRGGWRACLPLW
jgi:hypothetical protein